MTAEIPASENLNGQPQTVGSTGNEQTDFSEIGALNEMRNIPDEHELQQKPVTQSPAPVPLVPKQEEVTQPSDKDARHAATKINELNDAKMDAYRLALEANEKAIFKIAEKDPKAAEKLLSEYDYGTESLQELLAQQANPGAKPEEIKRDVEVDSTLSGLKEDLFNEKVLRLQREHPDLEGELLDEFKNVYSNPYFNSKTERQKLDIARAALGKPQQTDAGKQVALDLLTAAQGSSGSPKEAGARESTKQALTAESRQRMEMGGVSEKDLNKYIPDNFDDIVQKAFHYAAQ